MMISLYDILGVEVDASDARIKSAYRKLAAIHHPDKGGDPDRFMDIKKAYDVLKDHELRQRYDSTGRIGPSKVTPAAIKKFINDIVRSVVHSHTMTGASDDPTTEDVKQKIIRSIVNNIQEARLKTSEVMTKLNRANEVYKRFKPLNEDKESIIHQSLKGQVDELRKEHQTLTDNIELAEEVIKIFNSYSYEVDPRAEGQYTRGSTTRRSGSFTNWA